MTELQTSQMKVTPQAKKSQDEDAQLDALARTICDRINSHLEIELQRNGYHRYTSIFSRGMMLVAQNGSKQSGSSPSKPNSLELLTQEVETLLRQRLVLEQERQGRFGGRLPW